jgi:hypothetical protein
MRVSQISYCFLATDEVGSNRAKFVTLSKEKSTRLPYKTFFHGCIDTEYYYGILNCARIVFQSLNNLCHISNNVCKQLNYFACAPHYLNSQEKIPRVCFAILIFLNINEKFNCVPKC